MLFLHLFSGLCDCRSQFYHYVLYPHMNITEFSTPSFHSSIILPIRRDTSNSFEYQLWQVQKMSLLFYLRQEMSFMRGAVMVLGSYVVGSPFFGELEIAICFYQVVSFPIRSSRVIPRERYC